MKTLVLIRHAKSDWSGDHSDRDRPLAKRGLRQAPESGAWIAANLTIDLAVVSPAQRARSTWELVAAELTSVPEVSIDDRVYDAWGHELVDVVRTLPATATTVALVGHNPSIEELAEHLTGRFVPLPTSAVAVIDLLVPWAKAGPGATLRTSGRPPT